MSEPSFIGNPEKRKPVLLRYAKKIWILDHRTDKELRFTIAPAVMNATGKYLRNWRKRAGMTQTKAAVVFKLSQSAIAKMEKGDLPLKKGMVEELFEHYKSLRINKNSEL